jgi:hypothetical protein
MRGRLLLFGPAREVFAVEKCAEALGWLVVGSEGNMACESDGEKDETDH